MLQKTAVEIFIPQHGKPKGYRSKLFSMEGQWDLRICPSVWSCLTNNLILLEKKIKGNLGENCKENSHYLLLY